MAHFSAINTDPGAAASHPPSAESLSPRTRDAATDAGSATSAHRRADSGVDPSWGLAAIAGKLDYRWNGEPPLPRMELQPPSPTHNGAEASPARLELWRARGVAESGLGGWVQVQQHHPTAVSSALAHHAETLDAGYGVNVPGRPFNPAHYRRGEAYRVPEEHTFRRSPFALAGPIPVSAERAEMMRREREREVVEHHALSYADVERENRPVGRTEWTREQEVELREMRVRGLERVRRAGWFGVGEGEEKACGEVGHQECWLCRSLAEGDR